MQTIDLLLSLLFLAPLLSCLSFLPSYNSYSITAVTLSHVILAHCTPLPPSLTDLLEQPWWSPSPEESGGEMGEICHPVNPWPRASDHPCPVTPFPQGCFCLPCLRPPYSSFLAGGVASYWIEEIRVIRRIYTRQPTCIHTQALSPCSLVEISCKMFPSLKCIAFLCLFSNCTIHVPFCHCC